VLSGYLQAIAPLIESSSGVGEAGLTQLCRDLLDRNPRWMTAGEIRVLLLQIGIDLSPYTNPMAVLHSILKRVAQGHRGDDGTLQYAAYGVGLLPRNQPLPLDSPEPQPRNEPLPLTSPERNLLTGAVEGHGLKEMMGKGTNFFAAGSRPAPSLNKLSPINKLKVPPGITKK
jgi:hypothetical protein